ncbi:MAG: hypothetical protein EBU46_12695 [Nitrosomonadaceae bacterium]|nr:hypothetical protein [Nitrosomonadaceae bacterium]
MVDRTAEVAAGEAADNGIDYAILRYGRAFAELDDVFGIGGRCVAGGGDFSQILCEVDNVIARLTIGDCAFHDICQSIGTAQINLATGSHDSSQGADDGICGACFIEVTTSIDSGTYLRDDVADL